MLVLTFCWHGQSLANVDTGMVIAGSVMSVSTRCLSGDTVTAIEIYFQVRNSSQENIIFIHPFSLFNARIFDQAGFSELRPIGSSVTDFF